MISIPFVPDLIIAFECKKTCGQDGYGIIKAWGDEKIFEYSSSYILTLLPKEDCLFFTKKGLGVYHIEPAHIGGIK